MCRLKYQYRLYAAGLGAFRYSKSLEHPGEGIEMVFIAR